MADTSKPKIPTAPKLLIKEARAMYKELYSLLIAEDRGDAKYRYSVAVAANSLYYYTQIAENTPISNDMSVKSMGESIRALNSASNEWARSARALLLTPEAELKMKEEPPDTDAAAPPTLDEIMGEMLKSKSRNDNYGTKRPASKKEREKRQQSYKKKK